MSRHCALPRFVPALAIAFFALGCKTEEKIVYTDPVTYNPPADAANGYVGYYTVSSKQTTCGNCHADFQAEWKETKHASAYTSLASLPAGTATAACYSCHGVTDKGNNGGTAWNNQKPLTKPAGYDKSSDSTYRDVQCEACHGPGQQHIDAVKSGSLAIIPRAHLGVGPDTAAGCGACHTGVHTPFLEQWKASRHALIRYGSTGSPAGNASCRRCHEGRGALQDWYGIPVGAQTPWSEGSWSAYPTGTAAQMIPTACGVCHDPHGGPNSYQTRFPINSTDPSQNLCIKCHNRVATPDAGSSPHGPQGATLLGFAGYRPPNFVYDTARIFGTHATTANPGLCAGCHVQRQTINDPSGKFQFQSVGHLFKPIPCLNAQGIPTDDDSCAFTSTARSWNACTKSGCHADANAASSAFNNVRNEVQALIDILWKNLGGGQGGGGVGPLLDPYPTDDGYLPLIKKNLPGEWSTTDNVIKAPEGCEFNVRMTAPDLASHPDGSKGTHNPFLYRALLSQCISYLKSQYPFLPSPPANVQAIIDKWASPVMGNAPVIARVPLPAFDR